MPVPTNRGTYGPYYEVLDRALDSQSGIRIECADKGSAFQYRVRIHAARTLDRELNKSSREPDDPSFGRSDYDNLIVRVRNNSGRWWVYIQPNTLPNNIEDLDNDTIQANSPRAKTRSPRIYEDAVSIHQPNPEPLRPQSRRLFRR